MSLIIHPLDENHMACVRKTISEKRLNTRFLQRHHIIGTENYFYFTWQVYIICNTKWFTSINELIAPLPRVVKCVFRPPVINTPCVLCRNIILCRKSINTPQEYTVFMSEKWEKNSLYIFFLGFLWQIDKWIVYSFSLSSFQFQVRFLSDNVWWALIDDLSEIISALFLFLSLSLSLPLLSFLLFRPYITFLFRSFWQDKVSFAF